MAKRSEPQVDAPVPALPAPVEIVPTGRLIPAQGLSLDQCPTSLDFGTEEGRIMALAALGESDYVFDANGTCEIAAVHYLVTPGEAVDPETGELERFPRTVLIDQAGKTLVTTSKVIPHRLAAVIDLWGPGPWKPPLRIVIMERRSRRTGRTYHDLRMVGRA